MRHWILLLMLAQVIGRSTPVSAASLEVADEAACLDAAQLTAVVERELGTPLGAAVPLRFEVSATKQARGYGARLDVFDDRRAAARRRVVHAADCETLQETVAVAMTLALTADSEAAPPVPALNLPDDASSAPENATPFEEHTGTPLTGANRAWAPSLSAGLLLDAGTLPVASLGASIGAALGVGRFQLQALGTLLFNREVDIADRLSPQAAATLGFVGAGVLACTPLFETAGALTSRACLGWELGVLTGQGRGVARPQSGRLLWSAPRLDIGGRVPLSGTPWGLVVSMAALAPLNRDDFTLGPEAIVHRPPVVVGRATVGIDRAFE